MSFLFLAPHGDDECLFGSFSIMRYQPHVVVVYKSAKQMRHGITAIQREHETEEGGDRAVLPVYDDAEKPEQEC